MAKTRSQTASSSSPISTSDKIPQDRKSTERSPLPTTRGLSRKTITKSQKPLPRGSHKRQTISKPQSPSLPANPNPNPNPNPASEPLKFFESVYKRKPGKPDIRLLHAKIVVACKPVVKVDVYQRVVGEYGDTWSIKRGKWPLAKCASAEDTSGEKKSVTRDASTGQLLAARGDGEKGGFRDGFRERYYVLCGQTWELKQYGFAWEAKIVASGNPGIYCGQGVWIYVKDAPAFHELMAAFTSQGSKFGALHLMKQNIIDDVLKRKLVGDEDKDEDKDEVGDEKGSLLHCWVKGAVKRIREGRA